MKRMELSVSEADLCEMLQPWIDANVNGKPAVNSIRKITGTGSGFVVNVQYEEQPAKVAGPLTQRGN